MYQDLSKQVESEILYKKEVLIRIIETIKFLASNGWICVVEIWCTE